LLKDGKEILLFGEALLLPENVSKDAEKFFKLYMKKTKDMCDFEDF